MKYRMNESLIGAVRRTTPIIIHTKYHFLPLSNISGALALCVGNTDIVLELGLDSPIR